MMQQTNLNVYSEKKKLYAMQRIVYDNLRLLGEATDMELTKFIGYDDPNRIRPRRNELIKLGIIEEVCKKKCKVTGKNATVWRIKQ